MIVTLMLRMMMMIEFVAIMLHAVGCHTKPWLASLSAGLLYLLL